MRDCRPLRTSAGSSWRGTRQPAPSLPSSGGSNLHALPRGVCCTIGGTLIVAAWAAFGRLRGRVVTMVMARSYVWAGPLAGNPGRGADSVVIPV
jgi:hypothetical protein